MGGGLYILDGDVVRAAPDAAFWAEWMDDADRVIELSVGFTPSSRWELTSFFYGLALKKAGGPFFFVTQLAEGTSVETLELRQEPVLSRTKADALVVHAHILNELRPSPDGRLY